MVFVLKEALGTNFLRFQTSCPFFARKFIRHVILVAAVRRENTSAFNAFVFVCVLSSLPPARHTEAAFLLSGQHSYVVGLRRTCVSICQIETFVTYLTMEYCYLLY